MFADVGPIAFAAPAYLWLLALPPALLVLWAWRVVRRATDLRRLREARVSPVRERWSLLGDLPLWLCVVLACAALVLALARPRGVAPGLGRAGLDIVVLQDGSASMYVRDAPARHPVGAVDAVPAPARRRPAVGRRPRRPHRLRPHRDAAGPAHARSEHGVLLPRSPRRAAAVRARGRDDVGHQRRAGHRLGPARAREGPRDSTGRRATRRCSSWFPTAKPGAARSRAPSIGFARQTSRCSSSASARSPAVACRRCRSRDDGDPPPTVSHLDRRGLQRLAAEGRGLYFELDRELDRDIANAVIDAGRRSAPPKVQPATATDLHWPLIAGACAIAALGALFAARRPTLWLQLAGAGVAAVAMRVLW